MEVGRFVVAMRGAFSKLVAGSDAATRKSSWRRAASRAGIATLLALLAWTAVATTYVYDANGRLVVATSDAGASARYVYDEMGNLTKIERLAAGDLAIFGFSPSRGAPGASVRITGFGFSTTPAQNAVKFNGVAANVSSASAGELTAIVPTGATTGPIMITVGAQSVGSAADFIIDQNARPPVITNVSPLVAASGTSVTVDGQYMMPIAEQTSVLLNLRTTLPTSLLNSRAVFPVPARASSGKVTVSTPYGAASSVQDVLVVPSGIKTGDIAQMKRLALDASAQSFAITTAGQYTAVLFDGAVGDYLSAQFSNISVGSISYTLYDTANTPLANGVASLSSPTFHLPKLPVSGTYLLLMKPDAGTATWKLLIEKAKIILNDGALLSFNTTNAHQGKRFNFTAIAGQDLGFGISELMTPGYNYADVGIYVYKPDGNLQASNECYAHDAGCDINMSNLEAGTYSVIINEPIGGGSDGTMSFKASLSTDVTGLLTRNSASTLVLSRRGQNGRLSFAGAAGETMKLQIAGQMTVPTGNGSYYSIYNPDGTLLKSAYASSDDVVNLPDLPETGSYRVFVDPAYGASLSSKIMILADVTGDLIVDGSSNSYVTTMPGQNVRLTFTTTAGQNLGLGISDLTVSALGYVYFTVRSTDGWYDHGYCEVSNGGCGLNLPDVAATYSVVLEPAQYDQTMSFKATLSTDKVVELTRNAAIVLNLMRRGQNGFLKFSATAGESVVLQVTGQTTVPAGGMTYYYVINPDGTFLQGTNTTTSATLNLPNLPATGVYMVYVDSYYGETLNAQIEVRTAP